MKEKSLGEIESKTWFFFKMKSGDRTFHSLRFSTDVPLRCGFKNDFTFKMIFEFSRGLMVFGWITDAPKYASSIASR